MSGAVLGVTLLAGMATLGASVFIVKGENKELGERKADEAFAKSKLPYDFSLNRDGLERLRNLKGPLLLQAIKDPRMDSDRISRMTEAEFEELARSRDDVPQLLKESPETKMRDIVDKLFPVIKSGKPASGKVAAWVLMIHLDGPTLLVDGQVKLDFEETAAALMEMYTDPAFRFKDRCKAALTACIMNKTDPTGRAVSRNDEFIRTFPDNRAMVKLMRYLDAKSSTQLANMEVVKRVMFDEQDLRALIADLGSGPLSKFMKDYYMPRFSSRLNVNTRQTCDAFGKFEMKVGGSGTVVDANGRIVDDKISKVTNGTVDENNVITLAPVPPPNSSTRITVTVIRAFEYADQIVVQVSRPV
jgi:hypothetical protein